MVSERHTQEEEDTTERIEPLVLSVDLLLPKRPILS